MEEIDTDDRPSVSAKWMITHSLSLHSGKGHFRRLVASRPINKLINQ